MLQTLLIRDLALVHEAEIRFSEGFNVISGETGGGKSLVITALKLLRGGKSDSGLVRHGAAELRVDGEFVLGQGERSAAVARLIAEECGVEVDPEEGVLVVTRIVDAKGRSKARVNNRPTTLAGLRMLGAWLLEIHGQGDARALMRADIQAEILDGFLGTTELRHQFGAALAAARQAAQRLAAARSGERERLARAEFLRFQRSEMEQLALQPGELAALEQEHRVLAHLDHLRTLIGDAVAALQEQEPSAGGLLAVARRALAEAAEIDAGLLPAAEALVEAEVQATEAARAAQSALGGLELDPARLETVEDRRVVIKRGLSRFGPGEADLLANLERVSQELEQLEDGAAGPEALEADLEAQLDALAKLGRKLVRARAKGAPRLAEAVERELRDLAMPGACFRVALDSDVDRDALLEQATAHGPSALDFEVCLNPGEPFHSMQKTASGGEMARIVLALKKCLADQERVPFLVFDEVDAEIGGRLGLAIGRKLSEVAGHHQVLIVTHLPQVAAFAQAHLVVEKAEVGGRTRSTIRRLDQGEIEQELAAMAVGEGADAEAIREARRLVARAREQGA